MVEDAPPSAGEVRALATQLLAWADRLAARPAVSDTLTGDARQDLIIALADAALQVRRLRAQLFPEVPLAEPLWDVLLSLFAKEANGYRVSLDHLTLDSDLPAPKVRECVAQLATSGVIELHPDRFDAKVVWLSLSAEGKEKMTELMLQSADFVGPWAQTAAA